MVFNKSKKDDNTSTSKPKNIMDTKLYNTVNGGLTRFWTDYLQMLKSSFKKMSRLEQINLIMRACQITTIGSALLLTSFFYGFLPFRILALPIIIVVAFWTGTRIVSPIMLEKLESHLNREF